MLDEDYNVKIIDFGDAKILGLNDDESSDASKDSLQEDSFSD